MARSRGRTVRRNTLVGSFGLRVFFAAFWLDMIKLL
jgi:hypothetical protein